MELHFLGGAGEVGKSCISLSTSGTTVYLDCGLKMEGSENLPLLNEAKRPSAVILTHSHLDHCGAIPVLSKHGAPVTYCTTPTLSISQILYEDTLKIAKQQKQPAPFSLQDLKKAIAHFSAMGYKNEFTLARDFKFSFLDAGHIIGSAQVVAKVEKKTVVYTGDFNVKETRIHSGADIPKQADVLITECTYGNGEQSHRGKMEDEFINDVQEVVDEGGIAIVPCFAVGRTQEIITLLSERNFRGKIYLDGMGARVNEVYYQYLGYLKNARSFKAALQKTSMVSTREEKRDALAGGNVIIATAGMLEGGPVLSYLQSIEKSDLRAKIFIVGYQAYGTNGRKLLNGEPLSIPSLTGWRRLRVTTPVKKYEFSAHADQKELVQYVKRVNPEKVYCVHGDDTNAFAELLKENGFNATAPKNGDRVKI